MFYYLYKYYHHHGTSKCTNNAKNKSNTTQYPLPPSLAAVSENITENSAASNPILPPKSNNNEIETSAAALPHGTLQKSGASLHGTVQKSAAPSILLPSTTANSDRQIFVAPPSCPHPSELPNKFSSVYQRPYQQTQHPPYALQWPYQQTPINQSQTIPYKYCCPQYMAYKTEQGRRGKPPHNVSCPNHQRNKKVRSIMMDRV